MKYESGVRECRLQRQFEIEAGAFIFNRFEADRAPHPFDQFAGNCKAKSGTSLLPGIRRVGLGKFLENAIVKCRRNAWAMIDHADPHPFVRQSDNNFYRSRFGRGQDHCLPAATL